MMGRRLKSAQNNRHACEQLDGANLLQNNILLTSLKMVPYLLHYLKLKLAIHAFGVLICLLV